MKKKFTSLIFILFILQSVALKISDIRYGSYFKGKISKTNSQQTDHTRIIIELNEESNYKHFFNDNSIFINLPKFSTRLNYNYLIEDGLTQNIVIDSTQIILSLEGEYQTHKVSTLSAPFRIVVDIIGKSIIRNKRTPKPKLKQNQPKVSVIKRQGVKQKISLIDLYEFFPSKERIFIDLYELPFDQILRYFSKHSEISIIPDESISGSISLSIKNQTLASSFKLLLESKGFTYYKSNNSLIVTKSDLSQMREEETIYSVYLNYIKSDEMKKILNFYFSNNPTIMINSNSNLLEIVIPKIYITKVDSLIEKYDKPAPKLECTILSGIVEKSKLAGVNFNKQIQLISNREIEKLKVVELYNQPISINKNFDFSYYKEKSFTNGLCKSPSRIKAGFDLTFNFKFSRKKLFDISIKSNVSTINSDKTQFSTSYFERLNLELNENIIILTSIKNKIDFDDFLSEDITFFDSESYVQFIIITPNISGQ